MYYKEEITLGQGSVVLLAKGRPGERQTERWRRDREGEASLRIMERQLASGFCSAIEAITLHYADSRRRGKGREREREEAKHFHMN